MINIKKEKNFISAIFYTRNNAGDIRQNLTKFYSFFEERFETFEMIVVNDASTDETEQSVIEVFKPYNVQSLSLVNMSHYQGVEASVIAGMDYAIGDYVMEFDTIFIDYDFNVIMDAYRKCMEGFDIVTASPDTTNFSSRVFYKLFNSHSQINKKLVTERFRILSRRAINRINNLTVSITYRKAVYYSSGLQSSIFIYKSIDKNLSKAIRPAFGERMGLAIKSLLLFTDIIVKMAFYLALGMFTFSIIVAIYALWVKLVFKGIIEGWTTLMIFLAISFSGIFVLLAFLIKYVSLNFDLSNRSKNYIYSSFHKIV